MTSKGRRDRSYNCWKRRYQ